MIDVDNNRLRSIGKLAVVDGWFDQEEGSSDRYSLHLNASFRTERLGGFDGSNIRFRIELRQCEIVVVLPEKGRGFEIDPRTVARSKPTSSFKYRRVEGRKKTWRRTISGIIGSSGSEALIGGAYDQSLSVDTELEECGEPMMLEGQHTRSEDGHPSWIVTSPLHVLKGSLWDPHAEPRFTVIDMRPPHQVAREKDLSIAPIAIVQVRCKSEDLQIFDIQLKDFDTEGRQSLKPGHAARRKAAEAYLKYEIQSQNLMVGNIHDKFSDMTLAEYTIPLFR